MSTPKTIEQAAIEFVEIRKAKLAAKEKRKELMSVDTGFCENFHGTINDKEPRHCYQAFLDGSIKWDDFCEPCQEVHDICCQVKSLSAKTSGKLRVLINAVERQRNYV